MCWGYGADLEILSPTQLLLLIILLLVEKRLGGMVWRHVLVLEIGHQVWAQCTRLVLVEDN